MPDPRSPYFPDIRLLNPQTEKEAAAAALAKLEARSPYKLYWAKHGILGWREREAAIARLEAATAAEKLTKGTVDSLHYDFRVLAEAHREAGGIKRTREEAAATLEREEICDDPSDIQAAGLKAELAAARLMVAQEKIRRGIKLTLDEAIVLAQEIQHREATKARTGSRQRPSTASTASPF